MPGPWANARQLGWVHLRPLLPKYHKTCSAFSRTLVTSSSPGVLSTGQSRRVMYWQISDTSDIPIAETAQEEHLYPLDLFPQRHVSSTVWYIGHLSRMGTAMGTIDIRSELEGRISSAWGGDFVQETASENPLPGILSKAQEGKENQDVGLGQGSNYSWKWIWVGWDGGKCFGTSHLEFVALFFLSPFISYVVGCLGFFGVGMKK